MTQDLCAISETNDVRIPGKSSSVTVSLSEKHGRVLHSNISVDRGEEVFIETPILLSLHEMNSNEKVIITKSSEETGLHLIEDVIFLKSFCLAPNKTRGAVLDCYSPPTEQIHESELLTKLVYVADVCKKFDWSKDVSLLTLQRVCLIKACNAHAFYSQDSNAAALFALGSKMRHSCDPNVIYTSQRKTGFGSFIAKRDITAGEELFIAYIDTMKSVPMRQKQLLENYLFKCDCRLCTVAQDIYRGLICPSCKGKILRDQSSDTWTCEECGSIFSDSTKGITDEQESDIVSNTLKFIDSFQINIAACLRDSLDHVISILGPNHAATKLLQKEYIERALLGRVNLTDESLNELRSLTDSILSWSGGTDPSFLDSTLVEIACTLAHADDFKTALRYLEIVKDDMELLFGKNNSENEHLRIVYQSINGCKNGDLEQIPNFSSQTHCPVQF
jgi:ribosomal protein L37AE/L43A